MFNRMHCVIAGRIASTTNTLKPAFPALSSSVHFPFHPSQQHPSRPGHATRTSSRTMSDDAYSSFLDQANADLNAARAEKARRSSTVRTETVHVNVRVPPSLTSVDGYYVSETDEPFEPVSLRWEGASRGVWPDGAHLSSLISPSTDLPPSAIETLTPASFDPKNQYAPALRAVRAAAAASSSGDEADVEVKVYRVEVGPSRVQYYVLALDGKGGLVVGLRAKAIES
ncbi:hypothetical protein BDV59DRAFT_202028 [Aspergillus ambiguus]|uniref:uncharacterized protein n=1 Tax=Aspergillus ambiguus TaxID=176160 RepID=UPI003CCD4F53